MPRSVHTRTFPSSTRHLEDVRRFVECCCTEASMPKDTVEQVKIAVDEACANVIKHAYKGGEGLPIDVSVIVEQDHCTVSIRDQGESFRPNDYTMPDIFEAARQRRHGGFGVQIMRRLMDQVEYRSQGRTNEVCLTKYFSRTNGDSNH